MTAEWSGAGRQNGVEQNPDRFTFDLDAVGRTSIGGARGQGWESFLGRPDRRRFLRAATNHLKEKTPPINPDLGSARTSPVRA